MGGKAGGWKWGDLRARSFLISFVVCFVSFASLMGAPGAAEKITVLFCIVAAPLCVQCATFFVFRRDCNRRVF